MWKRNRTYLADPGVVLQARNVALVLGARATSVARRGSDGSWRHAIALLSTDESDAQ
jgi:hypothetical protein